MKPLNKPYSLFSALWSSSSYYSVLILVFVVPFFVISVVVCTSGSSSWTWRFGNNILETDYSSSLGVSTRSRPSQVLDAAEAHHINSSSSSEPNETTTHLLPHQIVMKILKFFFSCMTIVTISICIIDVFLQVDKVAHCSIGVA